MILVGDFFALGLICILCLFYFRNRYFISAESKYYALCLILTAINACVDIVTAVMINNNLGPIWLNMLINSVYFLMNILVTSMIGMVLFTKILEHVHEDHCMRRAITALTTIGAVYTTIVITNPLTKLLFYFDENGTYCRGPLNWLGYLTVLIQMIFVIICYARNKKFVTKELKATLIQVIPIGILCIGIQLTSPEILLNSLIMSLAVLILYLNFQNYARGVHTLTNLNDRHRFVKYLDDRITAKDYFTTYVISIKNREVIDQQYGHSIGDEIVYLFAFALEKVIPSSDVFHLDNLYFAICVKERSEQDGEENLDRIHKFMQEGVELKDKLMLLEYSILKATVTEDCTDATLFYEQLEYGIDVADEMQAKYFVYKPELTNDMLRRRYLISRLNTIDRKSGFEVWFQPVHCMKRDIFCSMEALIRLRERDGTFISPGEFIPIAEQAGLIIPITWFVIEEACIALSTNPELENVNVSVNVPMVQLIDPDFVTHLNSIVDKYGIDRRQICLEFTERVMLNDFNRAKTCMDAVSAAGYRFFLDDFGTGFSNFNCLLQLPFGDVKLDKSLTDTVTSDNSEGNIVQMLTELFHKMNLKVIAEGVESDDQIRILTAYGVDRIQGYYYSPPMNLEKTVKFYREHPLAEKILE